ncbi:MAG: DUF411 domain-containing protein [Hylemonella sp.]
MTAKKNDLAKLRLERRRLLAMAGCMGIALASLSDLLRAQPSRPLIEVWKSPTCGCCKDWIKHLEASGFQVRANDTGNEAKRAELGLPQKFASCHTARIHGYVIEGHVPAREIHRLLKERPKALGLSVPGMPIGSPGMDGPEYGGQSDPYDVLLVQRNGDAAVYASYKSARK